MTTKVALKVREGLGARLILGVDLTDTWYRFTLGFQVCIHVSRAVPGLLTLFLVVEQPLLHPKVNNHPAHSTLASSNSAALLPLALKKANHGAQIFALEPALCLCCHLLGCLRRYCVHILHEQEVTRDRNDCRTLRK